MRCISQDLGFKVTEAHPDLSWSWTNPFVAEDIIAGIAASWHWGLVLSYSQCHGYQRNLSPDALSHSRFKGLDESIWLANTRNWAWSGWAFCLYCSGPISVSWLYELHKSSQSTFLSLHLSPSPAFLIPSLPSPPLLSSLLLSLPSSNRPFLPFFLLFWNDLYNRASVSFLKIWLIVNAFGLVPFGGWK